MVNYLTEIVLSIPSFSTENHFQFCLHLLPTAERMLWHNRCKGAHELALLPIGLALSRQELQNVTKGILPYT